KMYLLAENHDWEDEIPALNTGKSEGWGTGSEVGVEEGWTAAASGTSADTTEADETKADNVGVEDEVVCDCMASNRELGRIEGTAVWGVSTGEAALLWAAVSFFGSFFSSGRTSDGFANTDAGPGAGFAEPFTGAGLGVEADGFEIRSVAEANADGPDSSAAE